MWSLTERICFNTYLLNPFCVFFSLHEAVRHEMVAFHSARFSAAISRTPAAERSPCTQSLHVFGLPLGRRPGASKFFTQRIVLLSSIHMPEPGHSLLPDSQQNTLKSTPSQYFITWYSISQESLHISVLTFCDHILVSNSLHAESVPMFQPHTTLLT